MFTPAFLRSYLEQRLNSHRPPESLAAIRMRKFRAPVLNLYAGTEHLLMASPCAGSPGMALCEDDLIFELHDDHTCVTNLFNRTLPLIRYRMEDVLKPLAPRDTGAPYRAVRDLVGRMEEAPVFLNRRGEPDVISLIVEFHVRDLRRFQVQLRSTTSFLFRAVLEPGLTAAARQEALRAIKAGLRDILRQKEMDTVSFDIEEVAELPLDPRTGKFKLIVR